MKFQYSDAPQRSKEWLDIRATRLGASEIGEYMAKGVKGQYLAGRKNIEKRIAFSKAFGVPFEHFINGAMQAGIDNEPFLAEQYCKHTGNTVVETGCYYNDWFVASPDREIVDSDGLLELKWLFDNEWSETVANQAPKDEYYKQMQGQLWATGKKWVDFFAGNGNTGRFILLRIERDEEVISQIEAEGESVKAIQPMKSDNVFKFSEEEESVEEYDGKW